MSRSSAKGKITAVFKTNGVGSIVGSNSQSALTGMIDDIYNDKQDIVASPTNGNLVKTNASGQIQDAGISSSSVSGCLSDVENLVDSQPVEPNYDALPLLCGQPMILFGNGTPQEAIVPDNWRQFSQGGYNWNGLPSALGQQYINYAVSTGGRYIAVKNGAYALKWLNC